MRIRAEAKIAVVASAAPKGLVEKAYRFQYLATKEYRPGRRTDGWAEDTVFAERVAVQEQVLLEHIRTVRRRRELTWNEVAWDQHQAPANIEEHTDLPLQQADQAAKRVFRDQHIRRHDHHESASRDVETCVERPCRVELGPRMVVRFGNFRRNISKPGDGRPVIRQSQLVGQRHFAVPVRHDHLDVVKPANPRSRVSQTVNTQGHSIAEVPSVIIVPAGQTYRQQLPAGFEPCVLTVLWVQLHTRAALSSKQSSDLNRRRATVCCSWKEQVPLCADSPGPGLSARTSCGRPPVGSLLCLTAATRDRRP